MRTQFNPMPADLSDEQLELIVRGLRLVVVSAGDTAPDIRARSEAGRLAQRIERRLRDARFSRVSA